VESDKALAITADLISAYLKNSAVSAADLPQLSMHVPELIRRIHETFTQLQGSSVSAEATAMALERMAEEPLGAFAEAASAPVEALKPAVPIEDSVTEHYVVCLEDGDRFRSLRPHLISAHGLTPEAYRLKWGLPSDHPIVAPEYSKERSRLASKIGLGKGGRGAPPGVARKPKAKR